MLPKIGFETAEIHGVKVRGLSRSETLILFTLPTEEDREAYGLSVVVEISIDDAKAWMADTPTAVVGEVLDKILELSGLTEGAQKSE